MIYRTETLIDEDFFRDLMAGAHPLDKAKIVYHAFCALADVEQVEQDECTDWLADYLQRHDSAATFLEAADKLRVTINRRRQPDCPYCNDGPYGNEGDPCPACGSGGIPRTAYLHDLRIGHKVRYHPVIGGKHDGNTYVVRNVSSAGVWLEGKAGMVAWAAVTPITEFAPQRKEE